MRPRLGDQILDNYRADLIISCEHATVEITNEQDEKINIAQGMGISRGIYKIKAIPDINYKIKSVRINGQEVPHVSEVSLQWGESLNIEVEAELGTSASLFLFDGDKITKYIGKNTDIVIPRTYSIAGQTEIQIEGATIKPAQYSNLYNRFSDYAYYDNWTLVLSDGDNEHVFSNYDFYGLEYSVLMELFPNGNIMIKSFDYDYYQDARRTIPYLIDYPVTANGIDYQTQSEFNSSITSSTSSLSFTGSMVTTEFVDGDEYEVHSIGDKAFQSKNIQSVKIGDNITSLGSYCFSDCSSLNNVTLSSSITTLGTYCFSNCKSLTEDGINLNLLTNIVTMPQYAFSGCTGLTKLDLTGCTLLTSIDNYAFNNCSSIIEVSLPNEITVNSAFGGCTSIERVTWTKTDSDGVFTFTNGTLHFNKAATSGTEIRSTGWGSFNTLVLEVTMASSVRSIYNGAFSGMSNLKRLVLNEGFSFFDGYGMSGCPKLEYVYIPSSLNWDTENYNKFARCPLISYHVSSSNTKYSTDDYGNLYNKNKTTLYSGAGKISEFTIPSTVTSISNYAFSGRTSLTNIDFSLATRLTTIGNYAFQNLELTELNFPDTITTLGQGAASSCYNLTTVHFPKKITTIPSSFLEYCKSLKEINVPEGVTKLSYCCFGSCEGLEKITIPESVSDVSTANDFCQNCYNLKEINWNAINAGNGSTSNSSKPFAYAGRDSGGCVLNIGPKVENLGVDIFDGDNSSNGPNITKINFSDKGNLKSLLSFQYNNGLTEIVLPDGLEQLGAACFAYCSNLKYAYLPKSLITIKTSAYDNAPFMDCHSSMYIECEVSSKPSGWSCPSGWNMNSRSSTGRGYWPTTWGVHRFYADYFTFEGSKLIGYSGPPDKYRLLIPKTYSIDENNNFINGEDYIVDTIASNAFQGYEGKIIDTLENIIMIETEAFAGSPNVSAIELGVGVNFIGRNAFKNMPSLIELVLQAATCPIIETQEFSESFMAIYLPSGNKSVYENNENWKKLSVNNGGDVEFIEISALPFTFNKGVVTDVTSTSISKAIVPTSYSVVDGKTVKGYSIPVTNTSTHLFYECYNLSDVKFPDIISYMGQYYFYNCDKLKQVTLPKGLTTFGSSMWDEATGPTEIIVRAPTPPIHEWDASNSWNITDLIPSTVTTVYVPANSVSIYKSTAKWSTISSKIQAMPTYEMTFTSNCPEILPYSTLIADRLYYQPIELDLSQGRYVINSITNQTTGESISFEYKKHKKAIFYICPGQAESIYIDATNNTASYYTFDGETLTGYVGPEDKEEIVIPNSYSLDAEGNVIDGEDYKVTRISGSEESSGFSSWRGTKLTIGNHITEIDTNAFNGCSSLVNVTMSNTIQKIGDRAFKNCSSLLNVEFPSTFITMGDSAFEGCSSMTIVSLPESVVSIGNHAFKNCAALTDVTLMGQNLILGEGVFEECTSLLECFILTADVPTVETLSGMFSPTVSTIYLKPGMKEAFLSNEKWNIIAEENGGSISFIEYEALPFTFDGASVTGYTGESSVVEIPDSYKEMNGIYIKGKTVTVNAIGANCFSDNEVITEVKLPDSITKIYNRAFYRCSSLRSINLPDGLQSLGTEAFYYCSSLESLKIPEGVSTIPSRLCYYCTSLSEIEIPDSVTSITAYAFQNCSNLTEISFGENSGLKTIANYAFRNCKLQSITLPASITTLSSYAFYSASAVSANSVIVTILAIEPPTIQSNSFYTAKINAIYVPDESVGDYKGATNWSSLSSKIYGISESLQ